MEILGKILPEDKRDKKTIYKILGLLVAGVILLIFSNQLKSPDPGGQNIGLELSTPVVAVSNSAENKDMDSYEVEMEKRLRAILKKMQGVGDVDIMITTTYGKERILAQDMTNHTSTTLEEDTEGGIREVGSYDDQTKVVMQNSSSSAGNEPVVIKEKQPEIQGVLIIAQGAGNSAVKHAISQSAQTLLGIPAHRVTVHQLQTLKK